MLACIEGSAETVQLLLDSKADVQQQWLAGFPEVQLEGAHCAMSLASAISSPQVVSSLLRARARVDSTDNLGRLAAL